MRKDLKFPDFRFKGLGHKKHQLEKQFEKQLDKHIKLMKRYDIGAAVAFMGALTVMLFVATYVISRLATDHAHRNKWHDCNDCGWS